MMKTYQILFSWEDCVSFQGTVGWTLKGQLNKLNSGLEYIICNLNV